MHDNQPITRFSSIAESNSMSSYINDGCIRLIATAGKNRGSIHLDIYHRIQSFRLTRMHALGFQETSFSTCSREPSSSMVPPCSQTVERLACRRRRHHELAQGRVARAAPVDRILRQTRCRWPWSSLRFRGFFLLCLSDTTIEFSYQMAR